MAKGETPNQGRLKTLNKWMLAAQGFLVMGIFGFFNTEYGIFSDHFATWGQYAIFPGFMFTELLMAGIATYFYLKKPTKSRGDHIGLAFIWTKAILVLGSGITGLGLIPHAASLSGPLMMAGLGLFAGLQLITTLFDIHQKAQSKIAVNHMTVFQAYSSSITGHGRELVSSFLLFAVVCCVGVANYLPELMFIIPHVSPATVAVGMLAGLFTVALAFYPEPMNSSSTKISIKDHELKIDKTSQEAQIAEWYECQRELTKKPTANKVSMHPVSSIAATHTNNAAVTHTEPQVTTTPVIQKTPLSAEDQRTLLFI